MSTVPISYDTNPSGPGLLPVIGTLPEILILGSYPSLLSLSRQEYYGNPKNQFWRIIEACQGPDHTRSYAERVAGLKARQISLWDVIGSCSRKGSGDSTIRTPTFNDIGGLLKDHPTIRVIVLNGTLAGKYFTAMNLPTASRTIHILPSTSPANAHITIQEKIKRWNTALTTSRSKKGMDTSTNG
ncbi:MAG: DNA-deoxyinosine glycosylase [Methanoregula sp.]|jgi:TDG/mug DNA glycosylase family protein